MADLINGLNMYLPQVLNYINNKKLTVSTAKSTVTLFTPDIHEHHVHSQVKLADQILPLEKKPKVPQVTLDTNLTFTQHCNNIAVKVQQRNNVLKEQGSSTWSCGKETLLTTFQAISRSILSYCSPVLRHHLGTLTGARHKILRCELTLAVLKWQMSPISIKRLGNYQFASITN